LGAEIDPKSVGRADLRQNKVGWKVSVAGGCVGIARSRVQTSYREREKTADAAAAKTTLPAILVTGRFVSHTIPRVVELLTGLKIDFNYKLALAEVGPISYLNRCRLDAHHSVTRMTALNSI
jgi:hypothetical protein